MKYFAYGSNLSLKRLQARVPSAVPLGVFTLPKHKLTFHKVGRDGTAKCDACLTNSPSDSVMGRLYEIDTIEKQDLERAEGLGYGYDEKFITIFNDRSAVTAVTYYATHLDTTLKPFAWYKQHVVIGAREANLPEAYIAEIVALPAIEDFDKIRELEQLSIHH